MNAMWLRVLSVHGHLRVYLFVIEASLQQILRYIKRCLSYPVSNRCNHTKVSKPIQKIHFIVQDYGHLSLMLYSGCYSFGWGKDLQIYIFLSMVSVHLIAASYGDQIYTFVFGSRFLAPTGKPRCSLIPLHLNVHRI